MRNIKWILSSLTFFSLLTLPAQADDWICKEASSVRRGDTISSCGIGYGSNENDARHNALNAAGVEFRAICTLSSDCKNHAIVANPTRTSCERNASGKYQCYRMIVFTIGSQLNSQSASLQNQSRDSLSSEPQEVFKPFFIEEVAKYPKIKKGMTKRAVLEAFGMPDSITDSGMMFYRGNMCQYPDSQACSVSLNSKGRVDGYEWFSPFYDDNLVN